jgi:hypothetical protein
MPQPPRVISAFKCPYCSEVFTIRWIHPWSSDEYDTSYLICPYCNQRLQSKELHQVGSFSAFQDDNPIRKLARKVAEYQKRKGPVSKSATARIPLRTPRVNHKTKLPIKKTDKVFLPKPPITKTDKVPLSTPAMNPKSSQPDGQRASKSNTVNEGVLCEPLIEACTLNLYQKNIFRITGLPVDATPKEVARQAQKLQMMDEMSGGGTLQSQAAFPLAPPPTTEQIREALARMKEPEHRLIDEFFWYWPERFGDSKNDPAIQAVLAGNGQKAVDIWVERESDGHSLVAAHNLAVMFHMYAVDWTNHHIVYNIDKDRDEKIKGYWRDAFDRWETLADADEIWDVMKERVRSLEDEALTTGFVRRMRRVLPQGFDRVNAEAALKFADQGRLDWTKYHVDFMRQTNQGMDDVDSTAELVLGPTKKRVEQRLRVAKEQAGEQPARGTTVAADLMSHCKPLLAVFDLFHGAESHHRSELFDEVAVTVADILVSYQKSTGDNRAFVELLKQALSFASGPHIRERLIKNIAIGENNLVGQQLEPFFASLKQIMDGLLNPSSKFQQLRTTILPQLPTLAAKLGSTSEVYNELMDTVALALRNISIDAYNINYDFDTANQAIQLALRFAVDGELKVRISGDLKDIGDSKCSVCKVNHPSSDSTLSIPISMLPQHVRTTLPAKDIKAGLVKVPRCRQCKATAEQKKAVTSSGSGCLVLVIAPLAGLSLWNAITLILQV